MFEEEARLDVPVLLSMLGGAVDAHVLAELRRKQLPGVTTSHGYVVQRLIPGPATVGEIAAVLGITQQAVSKSVGELARLGYAEQVVDPADRRRRPVQLTAAGRRAVDVGRRERAALERRLAEVVGADRLETAREVLVAALGVLGIDPAERNVPPPD